MKKCVDFGMVKNEFKDIKRCKLMYTRCKGEGENSIE